MGCPESAEVHGSPAADEREILPIEGEHRPDVFPFREVSQGGRSSLPPMMWLAEARDHAVVACSPASRDSRASGLTGLTR